MRKVCGTCRYNGFSKECADFFCDNEESDYYGTSTFYDDACEDWEDEEE